MNAKLKIGVTGASGLVGSYLCVELSKHIDCEIRGLHVSSFVPKMLENISIEWVRGDISDVEVLEDFCADLDIIIHTAAIVSFKKADKEKMFRINVEGTRDLVNYILDKPTKLIHISSIATLGRKDGSSLIDESIFWNESIPHTDYAKSKFLAEMEVFRGINEGLDAMILQPSIILGNSERGGSSANIWQQIEKIPWIAPQGANGFVDVADVCSYILSAIANWHSGEKLIINGHNISYKTLYELVNNNKERQIKVRAQGPKALILLLPFLLLFYKIIGKKTELSKVAIINTSKSFSFNNMKSIDLYGDLYSAFHITVSRYS